MDMELPEAEQADGEVLLLQRVAAGDRDALRGMVAVLDASFGPRGARIGQMVRSLPGMLTALVTFVESTDDEVTCDALHCIANICSDGLDIQSDLSKRQLLAEPGGAESIFSLLTDDEAEMSCRIGAAACLQNLCSDAAWAFVLAAESELVAGFHTEYGSMGFGLFFMGEYANIVIGACLTTILFLGGWGCPFGLYPGVWWFILKIYLIIATIIWIRWTFPRTTIYGLLNLSWKILIPLSLFNLLLTAGLLKVF